MNLNNIPQNPVPTDLELELVEGVKAYAQANYDSKGTRWDYVIETMSNADIFRIIKGSITLMGAKRAMSRHLQPISSVANEHAAEARAGSDKPARKTRRVRRPRLPDYGVEIDFDSPFVARRR